MAHSTIRCVFIGIDEYRDPAINRLHCAARDAQDMTHLFEGIGGDVTLLLNSNATLIAMRRAIWALTREVDANDTAIVYYAGHGARVSIPQRSGALTTVPCVVPYDGHHDEIVATGIAMEELGRCFESIPCKRVLFVFDSCYSGALADCRSFNIPGERSTGVETPVLSQMAGEGLVVLAASQEYQPAFEDRTSGHGIFTDTLIEALLGKGLDSYEEGVSLDTIQAYLQKLVPAKAQRQFNKKQTPVLHGTFTEPFVFPPMRPATHRTLAGFPHQFLPITVVVGDRREKAPKTAGDVFVLSASQAELRWLLGLGMPLDTEIVCDKVFSQASDAQLTEWYSERNLLVIGSPAANLLARIVNESALFPFAISRDATDKYRRVAEEIGKDVLNRTALVNFATDPSTREALDYYMNLYRKGGFIDPTYNYHRRGDRIPHDRDYGTVTLARNPYADPANADYVCILAAGVSLPGTMHSLAMLRDARSTFTERPFGGIFAVELSQMDWVRRVTEATLTWSTEEYDLGKLRQGLAELKTKVDEMNEFSAETIDDRLHLVEQITSLRSSPN